MKMNKKTRTILNLAICVMIALVGFLLIYASMVLFDFRMEGGYNVPENDFLVGLSAIGIILIENLPTFLGTILLAIGVVGILNNTKMLMR